MDTLKIFVEYLAEPLALILGAVLLAFATAGMKRLNRWLGIKVDEDQTRAVLGIVQGAVDYAEQQARRWAKDRGTPMGGATKRDEALAWAMREIDRRGLDKIAADRLSDLIESWLGGTTDAGEPVAVVRLPGPPRIPGEAEALRRRATDDEELAPGEAP